MLCNFAPQVDGRRHRQAGESGGASPRRNSSGGRQLWGLLLPKVAMVAFVLTVLVLGGVAVHTIRTLEVGAILNLLG
jgi:hypothetical protein